MPSPTDPTHLERLADLVAQRRTQLGLNKIDVARAADITITTYGNVESGQSVRDTTYGKIEPVLGWAAGSCLEVLRGGSPTSVEPGEHGSVVSPMTEDDIQEAVQSAAVAVTEMSAPDIRKVKQAVVDELRRRGKLPNTERN